MAMVALFNELLQNPLFTLFFTMAIGFAFARISINGFVLGTVGALIISILFGALGINTDPLFKELGFLIFIYAVGLQSGPKIFSIFRPKNVQYIIVSVIIFLLATIIAFGTAKVFGFPAEIFAGIFCGMFGSASGLGNITTLFNAKMAGFSFSFAYPIMLIVSQIFMILLVRRFKIDKNPQIDGDFKSNVTIKKDKIVEEPILLKNEQIANGNYTVPEVEDDYGVVITEVIRGKERIFPSSSVTLEKGDILVTEGYESDVKEFEKEVGTEVIPLITPGKGISSKAILVTNKEVDGKTIKEIQPRKKYGCVITRIWRSGIFIAAPESWVELELGDTLVVAGKEKDIEKLASYLGKHDKRVGEIDFLWLGAAIAFGILLGTISIHLPFVGTIKLGLVGGVLLVSLIFGYTRRLVSIPGTLTPGARLVLRELGVTLFIIGVGTESGNMFANVDYSSIIKVLEASLFASLLFVLSIYLLILFFRRRRKIATILAIFCGVCTNTPALGILVSETENEEFMIPYASVYPISQILVIIAAQALFLIYGTIGT